MVTSIAPGIGPVSSEYRLQKGVLKTLNVQSYARAVGGSWRMDETYIKVRGRWVYLYRAVDKAGRTVDFFLSRNRDVNAAKSFLRSAMKNTRTPTKITLDAYAASHRAVREMKEDGELPRRVTVRSSQYLNNLIEQDHRRVKQRTRPMLGFKRFENAVVTISGNRVGREDQEGRSSRQGFRAEQNRCSKFCSPGKLEDRT